METIFVKIPSHSNQFWDPTNRKQKMLVGRGVFEVQDTAEIQRAIANGALLKSSEEEFDRQEAVKTDKLSEQTSEEEIPKGEIDKTPATPKVEDKKPATKTSTTKK